MKKLKSYVIKNTHIDCDKDTYDQNAEHIFKQFSVEINKVITNEDKKGS